MSSSQRAETRLATRPNSLSDSQKLRSILFDTQSPLTLSPIQVFMFSMGFIFMVFVSHILGKIFPSVSPAHLFIAIVAITVSIGISLHLNKNK